MIVSDSDTDVADMTQMMKTLQWLCMGETFPPHGGIPFFENCQIRKSVSCTFETLVVACIFASWCHESPKICYKKWKVSFRPGVFSPAPHRGLLGPGPRPGFAYFELLEVSAMIILAMYHFISGHGVKLYTDQPPEGVPSGAPGIQTVMVVMMMMVKGLTMMTVQSHPQTCNKGFHPEASPGSSLGVQAMMMVVMMMMMLMIKV